MLLDEGAFDLKCCFEPPPAHRPSTHAPCASRPRGARPSVRRHPSPGAPPAQTAACCGLPPRPAWDGMPQCELEAHRARELWARDASQGLQHEMQASSRPCTLADNPNASARAPPLVLALTSVSFLCMAATCSPACACRCCCCPRRDRSWASVFLREAAILVFSSWRGRVQGRRRRHGVDGGDKRRTGGRCAVKNEPEMPRLPAPRAAGRLVRRPRPPQTDGVTHRRQAGPSPRVGAPLGRYWCAPLSAALSAWSRGTP